MANSSWSNGWRDIATAPNDIFIETTTDPDNSDPYKVVELRKQGRLWFLRDGMYVYYEPTHWRPRGFNSNNP